MYTQTTVKQNNYSVGSGPITGGIVSTVIHMVGNWTKPGIKRCPEPFGRARPAGLGSGQVQGGNNRF